MIDTKALRQKILDLAIRGLLVPQDPNDEPASVLLEKIRAEKQRLIKEGKIKKDKSDSIIYRGEDNRYYEKIGNSEPKCIDEELPFAIPDSWRWVRLVDLVNVISGVSYDKKDVCNAGIRILRGGNIANLHVTTLGAFLRIIRSIYKEFVPYLKVIFSSRFYMDYISKKANGTNINNIKAEYISEFIIPLPPLNEQQRIVDFSNELFTQIDIIVNSQTELEQLFDDLKRKTLALAICGKLVPQDPNDEPASVFLKRIRAEKKAQLGKRYVDSYIYKGDDNCYYEHIDGKITDEPIEIPFDIPENWCWARIPYVTSFQEGPGIMAKDFRQKGVPLIRIAGMQTNRVSLSGCNYLDPNMVSKKWSHFRLDTGDIVISASASMDKIAEVYEDTMGAIPYTGLIRFKMKEGLCKDYFKYFIGSECYINQINIQKSGTTIQHYGPTHIQQMIIPIPPLAEQNRIVAKLNEIFAKI